MRRFSFAVMLVLAFGFAGGPSLAADTQKNALPYASFEKWVGQYPSFDEKTGKPYPSGQSFWDDPVVVAAMKETLPPYLIQKIKNCWGEACAEKKIVKFDHFLMAHVCQRSKCPSNSFRLYFSYENGLVQACRQTTETMFKAQEDVWYPSNFKRKLVRYFLKPNSCALKEGARSLKEFGSYSVKNISERKTVPGGVVKK